MRRKTSETGKMGEDIACRILKDKGYRILGRNIAERFGEIDILARDPKGVLVFVEVKTLRETKECFTPEMHFNPGKAMRSRRIAMFYVAEHADQVREKAGWRIDLIAITITDVPLTDLNKDCVINHYENV